MLNHQQTFRPSQWPLLAPIVVVMLVIGAIVTSTPAAAQSGGMSNVIQSVDVLSRDVILVMGTMTVMAVVVLVAFGYFASRSSSNDDGSVQSALNTRDELELTDLEQVSESRADTLRDAGYESVADVHEAGQNALTDVDGIGESRAEQIAESAVALSEQQDDTGAGADTATTAEERIGDNVDREGTGITDEDERLRAVVTFDPETSSTPEDGERENLSVETEGGSGEHLHLRTILSTILTGSNPDNSPAVEEGNNSTPDSTNPDSTSLMAAITQSEDDARADQSAFERARATVTAVCAVICGRTRMLCDRRALDLRAYGVEDEWTALAFDGGADSPVAHELLEELVYVGAVPIEVATEPGGENESESGTEPTFADHTHAHLPTNARVRFPRRSVEWAETAAQADRPEAKRTVTLLRHALRATGASSAEVATGSGQ